MARRFLGAFHPDAEFALTNAVIRIGPGTGKAPSGTVAAGASGNKGLATWDDRNGKYWIVQLQC